MFTFSAKKTGSSSMMKAFSSCNAERSCDHSAFRALITDAALAVSVFSVLVCLCLVEVRISISVLVSLICVSILITELVSDKQKPIVCDSQR